MSLNVANLTLNQTSHSVSLKETIKKIVTLHAMEALGERAV
jgi:hypothetical protein